MTEFEYFLAINDPKLEDGLQPDEIGPLLDDLAALQPAVHTLVLEENSMLSRTQSDGRARISMVDQISMATLVVVCLIMLSFAAYAIIMLRRAQRSEVALAVADRMLRGALARAEAASAAKSAFLANMSHELRTPLNAIIGFTEFLAISASNRLDERQLGYLDDILASGRHLLGILTSILEWSKLEAGKVELAVQPLSAHGLIEECVRMLSSSADKIGVEIESDGLDTLLPIQGDPTCVRQIFLNLLSNAIKYSSQGGWVRVLGRPADGPFVAIDVADEGIGMDRVDVDVALRPFERLRSSHVAGEGVGLGLPIVKHLVEIHGGSLSIASALGCGTRVTVILPTAIGSIRELSRASATRATRSHAGSTTEAVS